MTARAPTWLLAMRRALSQAKRGADERKRYIQALLGKIKEANGIVATAEQALHTFHKRVGGWVGCPRSPLGGRGVRPVTAALT